MIVGPIIAMPMLKMFVGSSKRLSSSAHTSASSGPASRPPSAAGHVIAAQPPAASRRCHSFALVSASALSSKPESTVIFSVASVRSRACCSSHARASARNSASRGESSKSISSPSVSGCWSGEALGDRHPRGRALAGDLQRGGLDAASLGHDEAEVERIALDALGGVRRAPRSTSPRRGRGARRGARPRARRGRGCGTRSHGCARRGRRCAGAGWWGRARHRAPPRRRGRGPTSP